LADTSPFFTIFGVSGRIDIGYVSDTILHHFWSIGASPAINLQAVYSTPIDM